MTTPDPHRSLQLGGSDVDVTAHSSVSCVLGFYKLQRDALIGVYRTACWGKSHPLISGGVAGLQFLTVLVANAL